MEYEEGNMKDILCPREKIILSPSELKHKLDFFRKLGAKICLTTGAFDILHEGHLKYFLEAKKYGDALVVGVDSDIFVKKQKGEGRPVNKQENREFVVAGFGCVDLVTRRDDIMDLIRIIRPDYFIRSKTTAADIEGRQDCVWVKENCGQVIILDPMSENNTSRIIEIVQRSKGV